MLHYSNKAALKWWNLGISSINCTMKIYDICVITFDPYCVMVWKIGFFTEALTVTVSGKKTFWIQIWSIWVPFKWVISSGNNWKLVKVFINYSWTSESSTLKFKITEHNAYMSMVIQNSQGFIERWQCRGMFLIE